MSKNPVHDIYRQDLPEAALTPADVGQLKFGIALRGYAMSQVDDVLDRLAREVAGYGADAVVLEPESLRDEVLARLRAAAGQVPA